MRGINKGRGGRRGAGHEAGRGWRMKGMVGLMRREGMSQIPSRCDGGGGDRGGGGGPLGGVVHGGAAVRCGLESHW
ncbi:hypothetical protein E2C01_038733 [Portunus trituberculatus]|uniref:Uncharacterized protein n=1 Tax=Portunus trituberculatus TaxID=210409 RepID=A0A5B7FIR6_PORTR|nr:hypothetical protein [Portunus trituberculatus]